MVTKRRNRGTAGNEANGNTNASAPLPIPNEDLRLNPPPPNPLFVTLQQLDPQEAARLVKAIPIDPSTQIVRHLAIFRIVIFLLLVHVSYITLHTLPRFDPDGPFAPPPP